MLLFAYVLPLTLALMVTLLWASVVVKNRAARRFVFRPVSRKIRRS